MLGTANLTTYTRWWYDTIDWRTTFFGWDCSNLWSFLCVCDTNFL